MPVVEFLSANSPNLYLSSTHQGFLALQSEDGINSIWCIYGGNDSHLLEKELM
jgi:hypothetical protein